MTKHTLKINKRGSGFCGHEYCDGNCHRYTVVCKTCKKRCAEFACFPDPEKVRLLEIEHNQDVLFAALDNPPPAR